MILRLRIVFIRTGKVMHSVMLPISDKPDLLPVFLDFLRNDREKIMVSAAEHTGDHWKISKGEFPLVWNKSGDFLS